jgi:pyruvate ferredoxin oxidoreductase beta subunit/2-oxoisovalerate ferredoxin oxidoreductase beta subunit
MSIALSFLGRAAADRPVQLVIPACCAIVAAAPFPYSAFGAPVAASTFAAAAAMATGLAHVARLNGEATRVIAFAGDGGTFDIGMATLSAAAERDEDILYICYDNEIYGNTGGQRSSATPRGASTTTTPRGKALEKKEIVAIMAAHRIPYVATVSLAHAEDAVRKMRTALDARGFRFLHILSPCPTGWKSEPADGVELVRLAVKSGLYPVYEVFDGRRVVVNVPSALSRDALERYFALQGRFQKGDVDIARVYAAVTRRWDELCRSAAEGEA